MQKACPERPEPTIKKSYNIFYYLYINALNYKMKYIIIYNECLRSKIVYYDFIEKNKSKILEVIRVPNLTKKKWRKFLYLIKKFISSPICHKLYILVLVNLYLLINFL